MLLVLLRSQETRRYIGGITSTRQDERAQQTDLQRVSYPTLQFYKRSIRITPYMIAFKRSAARLVKLVTKASYFNLLENLR